MTQEELKYRVTYNPKTGTFYSNKNAKELGTIVTDTRYIRITIDKIPYMAHRLAFLYMKGRMPEHMVDHINHIRNDNRWCNLQEVTAYENQQKKLKYSKGRKHKYVYPNNGGYKVVVTIGGRSKYVGHYNNEELAIIARDEYMTKDSK